MSTDQVTNGLPRWLMIAFSGHRHLDGGIHNTEAAIHDTLLHLKQHHPRIAGVCSVASGADTIFAEEMLRLHAPLTLILPFDIARFKLDFEGQTKGSWDRAEAIIRAVPDNRIDVVHRLESDLSTLSDTKLATRVLEEARYYEATIRTIDQADILLAVWNEKPGQGEGGTADAVAYATQLGIPVIVYNPEGDAITRNESGWLVPDSQPSDVDVTNPRALLEQQLRCFDELALKHQKPTSSMMQLAVYFHLLASVAAAFAIVFVESHRGKLIPATFEFLILGVTWILVWSRGFHHRAWFTTRVGAEICRSFLSTWDIRRRPTLLHLPKHAIAENLARSHEKRPSMLLRTVRVLARFKEPLSFAPDHLFKTVRFLRALDTAPIPNELATVRDRYIEDRIEGADGQLPYFIRKLAAARRSYNIYSGIGAVASVAAFLAAITVMTLLSRDGSSELLIRCFEWAGITLPLVATACTFLMISSDAARRVHRYKEMIRVLDRLLPSVRAAPTWDALSRAVTEVEEELLQEIVEWQSFVHYTEHLH